MRTESVRTTLACLALVTMTAGCPKSGEGGKPAPSASALAPSSAAPLAAAGSSAPTAKAPAPAGKAATYGGTYSVAPASIYIADAKDFAGVKQAKDDPSKHVGDGALTVEIDAAGKITGTIDSGPAAPALIDGSLLDGEIRGNVRRKDPKDEGLTGTLVGKIAGEAVDGKLSLAEANAAIVREGKVSLQKK